MSDGQQGLILDGRCEELKFFNWVKSHWDGGYDMLQESKFSKRSDRLTAGEWREIFSERMLMYRDKHYYTRKGDLNEDLELTFTKLIGRMCGTRGMGMDNERIQTQIINLVDNIPEKMDAILVAEAILAERNLPSILDLKVITTSSKLKKAYSIIRGDEEETTLENGKYDTMKKKNYVRRKETDL